MSGNSIGKIEKVICYNSTNRDFFLPFSVSKEEWNVVQQSAVPSRARDFVWARYTATRFTWFMCPHVWANSGRSEINIYYVIP